MGDLYRLSGDLSGYKEDRRNMIEFTRTFGRDIEKRLEDKGYRNIFDFEINCGDIYRQNGFILRPELFKKHRSEIWLTESEKEKLSIIVRLSKKIESRESYSFPEELKSVAKMWEVIRDLASEKFGKSIHEEVHEIYYKAKLKDLVTA